MFLDDVRANQHGVQGEGQHILRSDNFNWVIGFTGYDISTRQRFADVGGSSFFKSASTTDQNTFYAYPSMSIPDDVTWTLGFSYDDYNRRNNEGQDYHVRTYSPKIGVQFSITEFMRLRLAAFEAIKPALFANRTIQPTQIAGFNQFYDGINGTTSWNYGAGFDARLTEGIYGGLELVWRDLDEPATSSGREFTEDRDEQFYRGYLYWAPDPMWAIGGGIEYDIYDSKKPTDRYLLKQVETLSFPISARYFSPLGFFGGLDATFALQDVSREEGAPFREGNDSFVVIDASVGYRFPQRRGLVSLEVRNLFDKGFKFQDDNYRVAQDQPNVSAFVPGRAVLGRATLNF